MVEDEGGESSFVGDRVSTVWVRGRVSLLEGFLEGDFGGGSRKGGEKLLLGSQK